MNAGLLYTRARDGVRERKPHMRRPGQTPTELGIINIKFHMSGMAVMESFFAKEIFLLKCFTG